MTSTHGRRPRAKVATPAPALTVRDKITAGTYKSTIVLPERPRKPAAPVFKNGEDRREIFAAYDTAMSAYEIALRAYHDALLAQRKDEANKLDEFKIDLLRELGVTDHPKAERLWSKAWDRGHATGLWTVLEEAEDLVDLIT